MGLLAVASCGGSGSEGSDDDATAGDVSTTEVEGGTELVAEGSDGEPVDPSDVTLAPVTGCFVTASEVDLTPIWAGQAPGLAVIVSRDDTEIYTTQPALSNTTGASAFSDVDVELGKAYAYSVEAIDSTGEKSEPVPCGSGQLLAQSGDIACGLRVSDAGLPEISWQDVLLVQKVAVVRDGTEIETDVTSPFVDTGAPPETISSYAIVVTDSTEQGREPQTIECGEATPNIGDSIGAVDLAGSIEASNNFLSPYQYVKLEPICPACSGTAELYLTPGSENHQIEKVWVNGSPSNDLDQPWMIDPLSVASTLSAAEKSGGVITYDIDIDTGLIREWSIDSVGARYLCFEVDTAPLDMRSKECTIGVFTE